MPSKAEAAALRDILHHIDLAQRFIQGMERRLFLDDIRTVYAATRCLEIIAEASRRLSDALKSRHPQIPRRQMAGAGNIYRNDYEDVAARFVWDTVQRDLPLLRGVIQHEIDRLDR